MPFATAPKNKNYFGFFRDMINGQLKLYDGAGAVVATASTAAFATTGASSSTTTVTGGTGVIATTGNITATAGDVRITAANLRLGAVSAFATTEPTSAVVMKVGTAPAGAITTSGGLFSSATVVQKIIAAGTVSNVETALVIGLSLLMSLGLVIGHSLVQAGSTLA